jgi:hypothetical protein
LRLVAELIRSGIAKRETLVDQQSYRHCAPRTPLQRVRRWPYAFRIVQTSLRLFLQFTLVFVTACGSDEPSANGGSAGAGSGSGGSSSSAAHAQLRFQYRSEWQDHLGTCAWISDYRIKFGANPISVTAPIEVSPDSVSDYVQVD